MPGAHSCCVPGQLCARSPGRSLPAHSCENIGEGFQASLSQSRTDCRPQPRPPHLPADGEFQGGQHLPTSTPVPTSLRVGS